jgi:hypothetical protein
MSCAAGKSDRGADLGYSCAARNLVVAGQKNHAAWLCDHLRVMAPLRYKVARKLLSVPALPPRGDSSKDAQLSETTAGAAPSTNTNMGHELRR